MPMFIIRFFKSPPLFKITVGLQQVFLSVLFIIHSHFIYAGQYDYGDTAVNEQNIRYSIGLESYQEVYTEYDTSQANAKFMQESASMSGINSNIEFAHSPMHFAYATARLALGQSNYVGAYQDASGTSTGYGTLMNSGIPRRVYEIGLGYASNVYESISVTIGLNQRVLEDQLNTTSGGYFRRNTLLYAPISIGYIYPLGKLYISPKAIYKSLIQGAQFSGISNYSGGVTNVQNNGSGYEFNVSFKYPFEKRMLDIVPFYHVMEIQNSNWVSANDGTGGIIMEPRNTTVETGIRVNFLF